MPATKTAPSLSAGISAPAATARPKVPSREFRLVRDERDVNGNREVIIQHLPSGITAQTLTGGANKSPYMEFAFFDPDDEPLYLEHAICPDNADLTDQIEFQALCDELRCKLADASGYD